MTDKQPAATTTDAGAPVESDEFSLTVGSDGPVLLHDHYLIEQMAAFNREPHAKGSGASGSPPSPVSAAAQTPGATPAAGR